MAVAVHHLEDEASARITRYKTGQDKQDKDTARQAR
jgi:hypothetical protein